MPKKWVGKMFLALLAILVICSACGWNNPQYTPEQQAKIDKFAPQIESLQRGDLVELGNRRIIFIAAKIEKGDACILTIPWIGAIRHHHRYTPAHLALQTKKIFKQDDPDYNYTLLEFAKQSPRWP